MRLLGIGDNNERVVVRGSDFEMMQMVAEEIRYLLDEQEFVQHTHVSYTPRQPEINLNFDPILLTTYDINRANITSGLTALNNEFSSEVTARSVTFSAWIEISPVLVLNAKPSSPKISPISDFLKSA